MHHTSALVASLASLGLICAIYYCNIRARPSSWLRSEMLAMILLSLLTGLFPLAVTAAVVGLFQVLTGGISVNALVSAGADLVAIAAILASIWVFRALVRATYRGTGLPGKMTPPAPDPVNRNGAPRHRTAV